MLRGVLRVSSDDWFGAYVLPPIVGDYTSAYPGMNVEIRTSTRLFSVAQREPDIAFSIVPFAILGIEQRRLSRLTYGVYVAAAPEPVFGEGTGFRLITHDTVTGQLSDINWVKASFPDAAPIGTALVVNLSLRSFLERAGSGRRRV
ncbi:LysR substrate-binding domain-containing protein [Sphingomonas phyllosphaerae]|uniref:LysR substrate-binding domain-containing protein n=1 Tax=Sphingomonas phyllosphaerae TaxID=257003 RepID=UPI0024139BC5|nr:LysR substrate-binding domain-containing protein [Sphingomonas phyllosphaerae]